LDKLDPNYRKAAWRYFLDRYKGDRLQVELSTIAVCKLPSATHPVSVIMV